MVNTINVLPIGVDSLSDYTPHKLQLLLTSVIPMDIFTPRQWPSSWLEPPVSLHSDSSSARSRRQHQHSCDLRMVIIRHGERVDRYFGPNWTQLAFGHDGQYRRTHANLPPQLPTRSNPRFWAEDTPLTSAGLQAAQNLGRMLASKHVRPSYVYSSPAMRCVLTTIEILIGLRLEKKLSIRLEPGLLELGAARFGMNLFMEPLEWAQYGVNVDLSYRPIVSEIARDEREDAYYIRSKKVIRHLEKHHQYSSADLLDVLIVGHATSPETLTWDLLGRQPNVYDLYDISLKVLYLQTLIAERKRKSKRWSLKHFI
jgi:broad specificity phosphatase PhoE